MNIFADPPRGNRDEGLVLVPTLVNAGTTEGRVLVPPLIDAGTKEGRVLVPPLIDAGKHGYPTSQNEREF